MSNSSMRLRLVVRRHALPEVRTVFPVRLENDPTIANLLEQINEVLPLESTEWGLEDYAVELRDPAGHNFDCMHFQQVSLLLKDDEEVFIRPLVTEDRKKRRLSGRDQISTDGKHLIDGIAFGRPRLRTPRDRPPIEIPPLKRRRLTYDDEEADDADLEDDEGPLLLMEHGEEEDDDDDYEDPDSVRVTAEFDDLDGPDDMDVEDEDADANFDEEVDDVDENEDEDIDIEDEIDDAELEDELRDLQKDNEQVRDDYMDGDLDALSLDEPAVPRKDDAASTEPELDLATLDKITALRAAFPSAPVSLCEKTLLQCNKDGKRAYKRLQMTRMPALSLHGMLEHEKRLQSGATARPSTKNTTAAAPEEDDDEASGSDAESVDSLVKHYDQHGFPKGSIMDGSASAHMAEALRKSGKDVKMPVHMRFDDDGSPQPTAHAADVPMDEGSDANDEASEAGSDKESPFDDEEDDDFDGNDNDFDDDDDFEGADNASDSDDNSADDSDSGPEEASSKQKPEPQGGVKISKKRRRPSVSDSDSSDQSDSDSSSSGSSSDEDADDANSDSSSDSDSDSSDDDEDAGNAEAEGGNSSGGSSSESSSDDSDSSSDSGAEQKTKKKSSSATTASSRPVTTLAPKDASPAPRQASPTKIPAPVAPFTGRTATQRRNYRKKLARIRRKEACGGFPPGWQPIPLTDAAQVTPNSAQATPDPESIAAKKVALLERLGLLESVSPSSPAKDDKAQEVHTPVSASSQQKSKGGDAAPEEEDPEAWRKKISYIAVECCGEDVDLSEPPFPFVQRWDPQQRLGKAGGKRKQRNNQDYYENPQPSPKKRRYADQYDAFSYLSAADEANDANVTLNYDDEEAEPEAMETDHTEAAAAADEEDDLPALPEDMSALPLIQAGDDRPRIAVTWKQFLLSKATNWQPQVLSLRGEVIDVYDTDSCRVRLAKKDRHLDSNEATYDEEGNRVYDKFELPVEDEMEEDIALGYRTIEFADVMELRILRRDSEEQEGPKTDLGKQEAAAAHIQSVPRPLEREVTRSATDLSTTIDHEHSQTRNQDQMETDAPHAGETVIPETILEATEEPEVTDEPDGADSAVDISISEERRHEISEFISAAGFRKDVDPSVEPLKELSSPSRQLDEEMSQERTLGVGDNTTGTVIPPSFTSTVQPPSSPKSHTYPPDDTEQPSLGTTNGVSFTSDYADSQPIILEPFNGFSDDVHDSPSPASRVEYPRLNTLHSDAGSAVSGRQPDPDLSFRSNNTDDHFEVESHEVIPETSGVIPDHTAQRELSPVPNDTVPNSPARSTGVSSLDSFPSLSKVAAAATSVDSRAPCRPAGPPVLSYEEAMRELDSSDVIFDDGGGDRDFDDEQEAEGGGYQDEEDDDGYMEKEAENGDEEMDEDDVFEPEAEPDDEFSDIEEYSSHGRRLSRAVSKLVNKPIEKPKKVTKLKSETPDSEFDIAPLPRPRIPRSSGQSKFEMPPPGSLIVDMVENSSEPEYGTVPEENYADDDIDSDWKEETQMPGGSGWVSKNYKTHTSARASRRGVSVPAASIPRESPKKKPSASQSRVLGSSRSKKSAARVL